MGVLLERHLPPSNPNRAGPIADYGARLAAKGMVIHSTANPGATVADHERWLNSGRVNASFHFISDWHEAVALLPWRKTDAQPAWHALYAGNVRFLGWEICEATDPVKFEQGWALAVRGVAEVLRTYGQGVEWILTHRQVTVWWEGTHTDPVPYFSRYGRTWGDFVYAVDRELRAPSPPVAEDWRVKAIQGAMNAGLLTSWHEPGSSVEMEELATVALRLHERVQRLERLHG